MMNSYDLRGTPTNVLDPYSLLYSNNVYINRQFPNNYYYPPGAQFSNNAKPPTYPMNPPMYTTNDLASQWLMGKLQSAQGGNIPGVQMLAQPPQPNITAPPNNVQPSNINPEVTKPDEKFEGTTMEEEVQIIEMKDRCYNKWCPEKKKPATGKDLKKVVINSAPRTLCKKCATAFENKQFCPFCYEIYVDGSTQTDGKDWVQCERKGCVKWVSLPNSCIPSYQLLNFVGSHGLRGGKHSSRAAEIPRSQQS